MLARDEKYNYTEFKDLKELAEFILKFYEEHKDENIKMCNWASGEIRLYVGNEINRDSKYTAISLN